MMEYVFYNEETQLVAYTIKGASEEIALRQGMPFIVVGLVNEDISDLYVLGGALVQRPAVPRCPNNLAVGQSWSLTDIPAGAAIEVTNTAGESLELVDFSEPLTFVDPGLYAISSVAPAPYKEDVYSVEVLSA